MLLIDVIGRLDRRTSTAELSSHYIGALRIYALISCDIRSDILADPGTERGSSLGLSQGIQQGRIRPEDNGFSCHPSQWFLYACSVKVVAKQHRILNPFELMQDVNNAFLQIAPG